MQKSTTWADLVFEWASERGSGNFDVISEVYRWARRQSGQVQHSPSSRFRGFLRGISDLGMAEIDFSRSRWSVSPPVVTCLPSGSGIGILTGSRSPAFRAVLAEATSRHGVLMRTARALEVPSTIVLRPRTRLSLQEFAEDLGAQYVPCAAVQLASILPPVDPESWPESWPPDGAADELQRFDPATLFFLPASTPPGSGLVAVSAFGRWRYVFGEAASWRALPRDVGVYLELARAGRRVISWTGKGGGELHIPQSARMPPLQARAATLCWGALPNVDSAHMLIYKNVPQGVATSISASLSQPELRVLEDQARAR